VKLLDRTPTVEAAEKMLADAEQVLARWSAEVEAKAAELADLQSRAGDEALDDPGAAGRLAETMHRLAAEQDVARRAVAAAGERLGQARRGLLRARAAELRTRAGRLSKVAEARQKRTDELLAALSEHEGAKYHPWSPACDGHDAVMHGPVRYKVPLTGVIAREAKRLEGQAAELERLAAEGTAEQVAAAVGRPMPEPSSVEREMTGVR